MPGELSHISNVLIRELRIVMFSFLTRSLFIGLGSLVLRQSRRATMVRDVSCSVRDVFGLSSGCQVA